MFMQIAIGAIGIGVVLMVGFIVIAQVRTALPSSSTIQVPNPCLGNILTTDGAATVAPCVVNAANTSWTAPICGSTELAGFNSTSLISCPNVGYTDGTAGVQVTVFAGFALIAVGIIVLAAFGLISVFK